MPSLLRRILFGAPKDVHDKGIFHSLSLAAILAWVGLGADGLSSSAYGPAEAFKALVEKNENAASLAVFLALATALTVFIISYAYSRIIEHFPAGGGGYVVATKLLGPRVGVVSGSALLVDYVLTITTSIASGGDALFDMVPRKWFGESEVIGADGKLFQILLPGGGVLPAADAGTWEDPVQRVKVLIEIGAILALMVLNIRGVKESVKTILPIFIAFVITHAIVLTIALGGHVGEIGAIAHQTSVGISKTTSALGVFGAIALAVRAYSLGGGTYTGIEAVSNGVPIMAEPRVRTAKRTMVLMATSLAITAGGIFLAYLLVGVSPVSGQTMNGLLIEKTCGHFMLGGVHVGYGFLLVALASEAGLLFIAAQAGFVDGPRVMANMAVDSWLPHRFAALSERLSMQNGVTLMGFTSILALVYTHGDVSKLVVMYSINVFVTFSLSNLAMSRFWIGKRKEDPMWRRHLPVHLLGLALCATILVVTCIEKFGEGGWLTLVITGVLVAVAFFIKRHYGHVLRAIKQLDKDLPDPLADPEARLLYTAMPDADVPKELDRRAPIAVLFVGGYGGLGRHALLVLLRMFPNHFKGVVFCSIAIVDSGVFKGENEVTELEARVAAELDKYVEFSRTIGLPAERTFTTGTEVAVEAEQIALEQLKKYPRALFVAGQLLFREDSAITRILHNETAFQIQRRLQHNGMSMVVLPVRLEVGPRSPVPSTPDIAA